MANVTYNISASYIGDALGDSRFQLYHTECGVIDNLVTEVTKNELSGGLSIQVDENIEKIYLVPILDDPLGSDCILGCLNEWSELTLSNYVPASPTPTPTPTISPTATVTPTVTPSITPTPSSTPPSPYVTFDLDQILTKPVVDRLQLKISGPVWQRPSVAGAIAQYATNGTPVPQSTSITSPNAVAIGRSFRIYTEGESLIVSVLDDYDAQVFWIDDGTDSYVFLDNISLPASISPPSTATDLKYLEI